MLTVAKVTGRQAAGYADYLQGKTQATELGDYYLKDGERVEAPGRWVTGATAVGCDPQQPVAKQVLWALMEVRRPDTGQPLRRAGASGTAVAALDATFSAPKTVSAVWATGTVALRGQIEAAHERAIDRALAYAVAHVAMVRERVSREHAIHVHAADVVATSWRHTTGRAVGDRPPDPQLHSHVLIHGAVGDDGRVMAVDSRTWLVHRRELGAAYRTELARELNRLGFTIRRGTGRGGRYFEIDGVPEGLVDRWSSRHHEVQDAVTHRLREKERDLAQMIDRGGVDAADARHELDQLRRSRQLPASEDRYMAYATRSPKHPRARADLDRHWTTTAHQHQFSQHHLQELRSGGQRPMPAVDPRAITVALTDTTATFRARDARAVALETNCGSPIETALDQLNQLRADGELLELDDQTLTTREHRDQECATVMAAEHLARDDTTPIPSPFVTGEAERLDAELARAGGRLRPEQRAALHAACARRPLTVIEGQAGTGKSTVLTAIARAHQAAGQQIIVTSTAALAAQRLATDLHHAGVTARAYSTAALRHRIATNNVTLTPTTTIIHDEAALASTRELHPLLTAVHTSGARLILVGDPRQSQAVGAGGLWPDIEHAARNHTTHVQLTHNVRALHPADRRDQALFRRGHHHQALHGYAARGHIHLATTQPHAEDTALEAAHADHQAGKHTLVIAQTTNEHLDELNARAQAIRRDANQLGRDTLPLVGRPYQLHPGDPVQIRHTILHPTLSRLPNGTTATVAAINPADQTATLHLPDDHTAVLTRRQLDAAHVRLGYVQHPFPAQGTTTDTAHLIITPHSTQEGNYVALTRAQHTTHIYASHDHLDPDPADGYLTALADRMSRHEPELPSIATPLAREQDLTPTVQPDPGAIDTPERPPPTLPPQVANAPHVASPLPLGQTDPVQPDQEPDRSRHPTDRTRPSPPGANLETPDHGTPDAPHLPLSDHEVAVKDSTTEPARAADDESYGWEA